MATQSHAGYHLRAGTPAGALILGAILLVAGGTVAFLGAQEAGTIDTPQVAKVAPDAASQPILLTATSVERARIVGHRQPILLTATSVERARIVGAATGPTGAAAGELRDRRGGP